MMSALTFCLVLGSLIVTLPRVSADNDVNLASNQITVVLSQVTGQVKNLLDSKGSTLLAGNDDHYELNDKLSTENEDVVTKKKTTKDKVYFEGVNKKIGLKFRKEYQVINEILTKRVTYTCEGKAKLLLRVSSASMIEPALYQEGFYYVPTDDGYKVSAVPFVAASSVKESIPWTVSTGNFVFYFPKQDRTFAQYRFRVNGMYFYSDADRNLESKFVPGGAVTAIGEGFINEKIPLALETRFVLLKGDARDYHEHCLSQPPYSLYINRKVPEWFKNSRMFLGDYIATGKALTNERDLVAKDVLSMLKLLREDQYLMVFFNHWTVQGDFPYKGTYRYYDYAKNVYSDPVPIEKLKENIAWLKAFSPRIKVGGYATLTPSAGTPPYDDHKDWVMYNREGKVEFSGDGTVLGGLPDFSSGYREYLLDQMKHYVEDLGFDWIHIDYPAMEAVNWKTKQVVQSGEMGKFYDALGKMFEEHDAAIVQNVSWLASLWAHGSYMECQQPDRWEKRDWRIVAVPGALSALYRNNRPGVWSNLCYGIKGIYGIRNAQSGMKGWIRGALTWWRDIPFSLAREKVVDELLEARVSDARVTPCWWKLQTDRLETEVLTKGNSLIIPLLLHGEKTSNEEITLKASDLPFQKGNTLFAFDMILSPPESLDVFKPVPWKSDYVDWINFMTDQTPTEKYSHTMKLDPLNNYYHILTQVPAWVYTSNGERTALLLSDNKGVKINGVLPLGAKTYDLQVESNNATADLLAFVPQDWNGVELKVDDKVEQGSLVEVLGQRCLLIRIHKGKYKLVLSESNATALESLPKTDYVNPYELVWRDAAQRLFCSNLEPRAYEEKGMSCLALKEKNPGGGSADFHMAGKERAGGFSIKMKGENSGGKVVVALSAGDTWTYEILDNFTGWMEFNVRKEQMTPGSTRSNWDVTTYASLRAYPVSGKELHVADFHLLSAKPGDLPEPSKITKRTVTIPRVTIPPVIDGYGNDPCWKNCQVVTDFYKYGTDKPADSKSEVRVCYDEENLYILFDNLEPITVLPTAKVPKAQVFLSDHSHFFLDPYRDQVHYFEIAADGAGNIADIRNSEGGYDMKWCGEYEVKTGLNYNVGWTMEMRIPFKTLGKKAKEGEVWGVTFARVDIAKEFTMWTIGEWNDPTSFAEMKFAGEVK